MKKLDNRVDMADLCELAHTFTVRECRHKKIKVDIVSKTEGDTRYTAKAQKVFDYYYDTITNSLDIYEYYGRNC